MVFSYSKLVNRRACGATSVSPPCATAFRKPVSIHFVTAPTFAASGRSASSSGGISPLSNTSRINSQRSSDFPAARPLSTLCNVTFPFCFSGP